MAVLKAGEVNIVEYSEEANLKERVTLLEKEVEHLKEILLKLV